MGTCECAQVFEAVEREFETLYNKHLKDSGLKGMEHRSMLMMMLAIATYRILNDEVRREVAYAQRGVHTLYGAWIHLRTRKLSFIW